MLIDPCSKVAGSSTPACIERCGQADPSLPSDPVRLPGRQITSGLAGADPSARCRVTVSRVSISSMGNGLGTMTRPQPVPTAMRRSTKLSYGPMMDPTGFEPAPSTSDNLNRHSAPFIPSLPRGLPSSTRPGANNPSEPWCRPPGVRRVKARRSGEIHKPLSPLGSWEVIRDGQRRSTSGSRPGSGHPSGTSRRRRPIGSGEPVPAHAVASRAATTHAGRGQV